MALKSDIYIDLNEWNLCFHRSKHQMLLGSFERLIRCMISVLRATTIKYFVSTDFEYDNSLFTSQKIIFVNIWFYVQHACFDKHQNYDIINLASFDATSTKHLLFCRVRELLLMRNNFEEKDIWEIRLFRHLTYNTSKKTFPNPIQFECCKLD